MTRPALVLTYHAIEPGPPPLFLAPRRFAEHLELIAATGVAVIGLDRLVQELRSGGPAEPSIAVTFDDGFASAVENGVPLLAERGMSATIFCVAGHLGGLNDFRPDPARVPKRPLASARALAEAAGAGMELGSHGTAHLPLELAEVEEAVLRREIVESRRELEQRAGTAVRWFAHPYGSPPGPRGRALIERTYDGACGDGMRLARAGMSRYAVPRVDIHYLRRPKSLRRALRGGGAELLLRRAGARARRAVVRDFVARNFSTIRAERS